MSVQLAPLPSFDQTLKRIARLVPNEASIQNPKPETLNPKRRCQKCVRTPSRRVGVEAGVEEIAVFLRSSEKRR